MTLPVRLAAFSLLLLLANCAGSPDDLVEGTTQVEQQQQPLFTQTTTPVRCPMPWGEITVTVHHDGQYGLNSFTPCALFDGDFVNFAIITYNGMNRLKVDMKFDHKRTLSGFHTNVGGLNGRPFEYSVNVVASCEEGAVTFPTHGLYTGKNSSLSFDAPCTTDFVSIRPSRDTLDGVEHLTELAPVFVDTGTPVTGDRFALITSPGLALCGPSVSYTSANILSTASGASVGKIQLWRASCVQVGTNTPVRVYYARSVSSVGAPADMDFTSTYLQYTNSANASGWFNKTITTLWAPENGVVVSNVWVDDQTSNMVTVSACSRFYPSNMSYTSEATAAGCTEPFVL
jgi:hypothetical protein